MGAAFPAAAEASAGAASLSHTGNALCSESPQGIPSGQYRGDFNGNSYYRRRRGENVRREASPSSLVSADIRITDTAREINQSKRQAVEKRSRLDTL